MAGRSKGLVHAALLADKHPAGPAHVAWNDHGLADFAVAAGNFRMVGRKGARGAFAVHPDALALVADRVLFEFGDVVADIVHEVHLQLLPGPAEDRGEDFAGL